MSNPRAGLLLVYSSMLIMSILFFLIMPQKACSAADQDYGSSWFIKISDYTKGIHGRLACQECHGDMLENDQEHPDPDREDFLQRSALRSFDYEKCKRCHELAYERYLQGGHAKALQEAQDANTESLLQNRPEEELAPSCGHCHNVHIDQPGLDRIQIGRRQATVCASCHPEHLQTYLKSTHGKIALNLGNPDGAFCTDCHGAHTNHSLQDQETNLRACRRCHSQAGLGFTSIIMHSPMDKAAILGTKNQDKIQTAHTIINIVRTLFIAFVILVLSLFLLHTLLSFLREAHQKLRNK